MSIMLPSGLQWVAKLAGGDWPEADEDRLWALAQAHRDFAKQVRGVVTDLGPAMDEVKAGVTGPTAEAFEAYLDKLAKNLPAVADAADQVADMCDQTALQVQYAKIMILMMLAWMAAEIAFLAWWAPEAVPEIVASGRLAVGMIVRRLLAAVVINVGAAAFMDALDQLIQFAKGHRHSWDLKNSEMAWAAGAINGAVTGALFGVGGAIAPEFLGSLLGKMAVGGAGGALGMEATDKALGMDGDPGLGFLAGALGGAIGHIPALRGCRGRDGEVTEKVPDLTDGPGLPGLGGGLSRGGPGDTTGNSAPGPGSSSGGGEELFPNVPLEEPGPGGTGAPTPTTAPCRTRLIDSGSLPSRARAPRWRAGTGAGMPSARLGWDAASAPPATTRNAGRSPATGATDVGKLAASAAARSPTDASSSASTAMSWGWSPTTAVSSRRTGSPLPPGRWPRSRRGRGHDPVPER